MNNIRKFIDNIKEQKEKKFFDKTIEKFSSAINSYFQKIIKNVFSVKIKNVDDIKLDNKIDLSSLKIPKSVVIDNLEEISKYIKIPKNEIKFDKIKISNLSEIAEYIKKEDVIIPDEFRVNNLDEIKVLKIPENLKKLSVVKLEKLLSNLIDLNKKEKDSSVFIKNKKVNEYIPVRLVDYKGKDWIKSFGNSVFSFPDEIKIKDSDDKIIDPATSAKQDDIIGNYAFQYAEDSVDSKIFYIGEATIGSAINQAVWRIQKYNTNTGIIKQWADGNANFDNDWDNREALSFS